MSDWIPIGEPEAQLLTPNQQRIKDMLDAGKGVWSICGRMRMRREHVEEEIFEIRRKESIMGKGKLTNTQRAAIWQAYKDGVSQKELAEQYNVSIQAISQTIAKLSQAADEIGIAPDAPAVNIAALEEKPMDKRPVAVLNEEFAAAVAEMEAQYKDADAEKKSAIAEPEPEAQDESEPLPPVVRRAVDGHLTFIADRIEALQYRISEIEIEIEEYRKDASRLEEWKEQQKWR